jgi:hypothetical protein
MHNPHFKGKLAAVSAASLLTLSLGVSLPATAGTVLFADPTPQPVPPPCAINGILTENDGGISYEWTVKLGKKDEVEFVRHVGAKSYNEPPPFYEPPNTGWTHTSDWVALELTEATKLRIEVERQEGVYNVAFNPETNVVTGQSAARNKLVPALSVYKGWDDTSCEDHRYNTAGNVDWSTLDFIGNQPNSKGKSVAVYSATLPAGKYSVAIGGSPAVLDTYPANNCDATDPVCYRYTGRHGYKVEMKTGM